MLAFSHRRLEQTRSRELLRSRTCKHHQGLLLAVFCLTQLTSLVPVHTLAAAPLRVASARLLQMAAAMA